ADTCCFDVVPTLNQTGELKLNTWCSNIQVISCSNTSASAELAKYPCSVPAATQVLTTRSISCLRLFSRLGDPTAPRKYLLATMFVALTDQNSGNSTPRCSKFTDPSRQLVITTSRRSQVTSSYGCTPGVVYTRGIVRPSPRRSCPTAGSAAVFVITLPFLLVAAAVTAAPILVLTRG